MKRAVLIGLCFLNMAVYPAYGRYAVMIREEGPSAGGISGCGDPAGNEPLERAGIKKAAHPGGGLPMLAAGSGPSYGNPPQVRVFPPPCLRNSLRLTAPPTMERM
jgi:hypothetical protein